MRRYKLLAAALAAVMVVSAMAPLGTAAAATAEEDYDEIDVHVNEEEYVIGVESNGTPVENATVDVTVADDNTSYADEGEHVTDEDGIVELEAPDETVDVTVTATAGNLSAEETATFEAPSDADVAVDVVEADDEYAVTLTADGDGVANATVDVSPVDENDSYAGAGEYTTDENGTFALESPDETVTVALEATVDDEPVTEETTLEPLEDDEVESFGDLVSSFVQEQQNDSDGPIGTAVANFVVENNPGNAPDHAGPPGHAGPPADDEQGPPADDEDDEQGPPEHAGPPADDDDDDDDDDDEDDEQGQPEHAGPPADDDEDAESEE